MSKFVSEVTDGTFEAEVLAAGVPVVVDFWAEWCPPCRALGPILEQIAAEHPELKVVKIDADHNPERTIEHQALALPTMKVLHAGRVVRTIIGAKPKPALLADLAEWLAPVPS